MKWIVVVDRRGIPLGPPSFCIAVGSGLVETRLAIIRTGGKHRVGSPIERFVISPDSCSSYEGLWNSF
jgi:hypothetical protein